jgi:hypothetical protein
MGGRPPSDSDQVSPVGSGEGFFGIRRNNNIAVNKRVHIKVTQERRLPKIAEIRADAAAAITHDQNRPTIVAKGPGKLGSCQLPTHATNKIIVAA